MKVSDWIKSKRTVSSGSREISFTRINEKTDYLKEKEKRKNSDLEIASQVSEQIELEKNSKDSVITKLVSIRICNKTGFKFLKEIR